MSTRAVITITMPVVSFTGSWVALELFDPDWVVALASVGVMVSLGVLVVWLSLTRHCGWCGCRVASYRRYCREDGRRMNGGAGIYLQSGSSPYLHGSRAGVDDRRWRVVRP